MSISSSSSSNASFLPPYVSSIMSLGEAVTMCFQYSSTFYTFSCFSVTNIFFLLPLHIFISYMGLQRWWKQRSASSAMATSHSDSFTYHMVAIEMIGIVGCGLHFCGIFISGTVLMMLGIYFFSVSANGQILIHILNCVERHLAVVHPVTYVRLRNRVGVRIRNAFIGCAWLLVLGSPGPMYLGLYLIIYQTFLLSILSLVVVSFCSLSVLHTLNRPAPGTQGDKGQVNQSKIRAFHTIMAIWATLALRFVGHLLAVSVFSSAASDSFRCVMLLSGVWFCLPSSLVLPLLFLHRAGKVLRCK